MVRRALLAGFVFALGTGLASAQNVLSPFPGSGVPVGRPVFGTVGQTAPPAAPRAGQAIGYVGPDGKPVSMERPAGQVVDLRNLAAPITAPLAPGLTDSQPKSVFEKVYDKWRQAIGLDKQTTPTTNNYTPGLSRRNRERRSMMWWRD
ncbi:MAG: hypothetical protein KF873_12925 [Gemmataceae bacterium]|nr:hypothetical protein [Planctomycetia bacterium]MBX3399639.1 hypothetical protein [Gemmataceae bacterium]